MLPIETLMSELSSSCPHRTRNREPLRAYDIKTLKVIANVIEIVPDQALNQQVDHHRQLSNHVAIPKLDTSGLR